MLHKVFETKDISLNFAHVAFVLRLKQNPGVGRDFDFS